MKFICDQCKTKYSIADQKVAGKVLKIRCKNCGEIIIVKESRRLPEEDTDGEGEGALEKAFDGAFKPKGKSGAGVAPGPLASKPASSSSILQMMPAAPLAALEQSREDEIEPEPTRLSAAPDFATLQSSLKQGASSSDDEWYFAVDGQQFGPMGLAELASRVKRGEARDDAFVWRDGFEDWLELNEVPELRPFVPKLPPPPPRKTGLGLPEVLVPLPTRGSRRPPGPSDSGGALPPRQGGSAPNVLPGMPGGLGPAFQQSGQSQQIQQIQQPPQVQMYAPSAAPPQPSLAGLPLQGGVPLAAQGSAPGVHPTPTSDGLQALVAQTRRPDSGLIQIAPGSEIREAPPLISMTSFPIAQPAPQAAPAPKTPVVMKIAMVAGIVAALSGIVLVVYFIFFSGPPRQPTPGGQPVAKTEPSPTAGPRERPLPSSQQDATITSFEFEPVEVERTKGAPKIVRPKVAAKTEPAPAELTPEQKRLMELYKKPAATGTSVPRNVMAVKASSGGGAQITGEDIQRVQHLHKKELQACYDRALKHDNSLTSLKANIQVEVGGTGIVKALRLSAGGVSPEFETCLTKSLRHWTFPSTGADSQVVFPIIFKGS
jgi:predicted Zn finger-like uncharacterized protein